MQLKKILKGIVNRMTLTYLRMQIDNLCRKHRIKKTKTENNIYVFGTATHGNIGDHLIDFSVMSYLEKIYPFHNIVECHMNFARKNLEFIKRYVKGNDIIVIPGGGWLGSVWREDENFVRKIICSFDKNLILIFPQTVFYHDCDEYIEEGKKIYSEKNNLLFTLRDKDSYDFVNNNGFINTNSKSMLLPDFALFYRSKIKCSFRNRINICFREDYEIGMKQELKTNVINEIKKYKINYFSTIAKGTIFPSNREKAIQDMLRKVSDCKLVVTDRLHCMIMAYLTGTPCIAFNNATKKVAGVYNAWLKNVPYIKVVDNLSTFQETMKILYNYHTDGVYCIGVEKYAELLKNAIKSMEELNYENC